MENCLDYFQEKGWNNSNNRNVKSLNNFSTQVENSKLENDKFKVAFN